MKAKVTTTEVIEWDVDFGDVRPEFVKAALDEDNGFYGESWHIQDFGKNQRVVSYDITYKVVPPVIYSDEELVYIEQVADAIVGMKPKNRRKKKKRKF